MPSRAQCTMAVKIPVQIQNLFDVSFFMFKLVLFCLIEKVLAILQFIVVLSHPQILTRPKIKHFHSPICFLSVDKVALSINFHGWDFEGTAKLFFRGIAIWLKHTYIADRLAFTHRIELPLLCWRGCRFVKISLDYEQYSLIFTVHTS